MKIRVGYWDKKCKDPLSDAGDAHGLLCAPTRRGKFATVLAQILLTWEFSCFVLDPKGQAAAVTGRYGRDVLKQDVYVINPFNILPKYLGGFKHAQYCPVTRLDPSSDTFATDADGLAEGWLPHTGHEVHWVNSARQFVSGIAMDLRQSMNQWSLADVYSVICDPNIHAFCKDALEHTTSEEVKVRLGRFADEGAKDNKEIKGIISAAITGLGFVANKPIAENMRLSTIDFGDMRKGPMTVYVILPARYMLSCAPWLRTITNAWADACLQEEGGEE